MSAEMQPPITARASACAEVESYRVDKIIDDPRFGLLLTFNPGKVNETAWKITGEAAYILADTLWSHAEELADGDTIEAPPAGWDKANA